MVHHLYDGWSDAKKTGPAYSIAPRGRPDRLRPPTHAAGRAPAVRRAGMRRAVRMMKAALKQPCRFSSSSSAAKRWPSGSVEAPGPQPCHDAPAAHTGIGPSTGRTSCGLGSRSARTAGKPLPGPRVRPHHLARSPAGSADRHLASPVDRSRHPCAVGPSASALAGAVCVCGVSTNDAGQKAAHRIPARARFRVRQPGALSPPAWSLTCLSSGTRRPAHQPPARSRREPPRESSRNAPIPRWSPPRR